MCYEILIVDDDTEAAPQFAEFINKSTKIKTASACDPQIALEIMRSNPIKVIVLDQIMPAMAGTELCLRLKQINKYAKCVMLTGEASADDVGLSIDRGYSSYLHKSNIKELPRRVYRLYLEYSCEEIDRCQKFKPVLIYKKHKIIPTRSKIFLSLVDIELLNDQFVFDNKWETIKQVNLGQTIKDTFYFEINQKYEIASESEYNLKSNLGFPAQIIDSIVLKIKSEIQKKFSTTRSIQSNLKLQQTITYSLTSNQNDKTKPYTVSRCYEKANVFEQYRCTLSQECTCCNTRSLIIINIYFPTNKIATRCIDVFSDNTKSIVDTNYISLNSISRFLHRNID